MNLYAKLKEREEQQNPLRVGLIGAGKFAAMYLAQVPRTPGVHLVGDRRPLAGERERRIWSASAGGPRAISATSISDDWQELVSHPEIDIVIEATGNPVAAVSTSLAAFRNGKHVIMVTVEADAFCGPLLAQRAQEAGVVYSLAYGDQPAIICDLVDWARAAGFPVVAAGRGHKWLPHFAQSTPETVWRYYGLTPEQAKRRRPESEDVQLLPRRLEAGDREHRGVQCDRPHAGAGRPGLSRRASVDELPALMRPESGRRMSAPQGPSRGGVVAGARRHARSPTTSASACGSCSRARPTTSAAASMEYGVQTDPSGRYACMYKRWHLIGLEVGISVASVGLRDEPTGCADRLSRRRRGEREARPEGRGNPRWRGRLHGRRPADAGGGFARARAACRSALRTLEDAEAGESGPAAQLERRGYRRDRADAVKLRREMESSGSSGSDKSRYGRPRQAAG